MRLKIQPTGFIKKEKTEVKAKKRKKEDARKRPAPHFLPLCKAEGIGTG